MNLTQEKYSKFALAREMLDVVDVVAHFNAGQTANVAEKIRAKGKLFLTGEGSSRIFPAKNAIRKALSWGLNLHIATDGSRQAAQYDLSRFAAFCASNSGRTKEVILFRPTAGPFLRKPAAKHLCSPADGNRRLPPRKA
jgi:glucosamine--fructose-6-phosphate aminotransferase (isomerizing)